MLGKPEKLSMPDPSLSSRGTLIGRLQGRYDDHERRRGAHPIPHPCGCAQSRARASSCNAPVTPAMQSLIVDQPNLYAARRPARVTLRAQHGGRGARGMAGAVRAAWCARPGARGPAIGHIDPTDLLGVRARRISRGARSLGGRFVF